MKEGMRRLLQIVILLMVFAFPAVSYAKVGVIMASGFIGGTTGKLDAVECEDIKNDGTDRAIATGDVALVITGSKELTAYVYDASGVAAEEANGPYDPIVPDNRAAACSGNGRRKLRSSGQRCVGSDRGRRANAGCKRRYPPSR